MANVRAAATGFFMTIDSTAELAAYVWTDGDVGRTIVRNQATGYTYLVIGSGAGMASLCALGASEFEIPIPLTSFREVTSGGDVGDITANGGVLASDTTPILLGDAAEALEITWATTVVDALATTITTPIRMDTSRVCYIDLWVASGSTDAATFTVETSDNGSAKVSDTASDASTKSATIHKITATIAAGDIAAGAALTIGLTPDAHATNPILLYGASFRGFLA